MFYFLFLKKKKKCKGNNIQKHFIVSFFSIWKVSLFFCLVFLLFVPAKVFSFEWFRPINPVADYAKVISVVTVQRISHVAAELWNKTGIAVVIVTLPTLDGHSLEEKTISLYRSWGIGDKITSKSVLILVAVNERRVRIEVGYGFEFILTELMTERIRDQVLIPYLKKGNYDEALYLSVVVIAQLAVAEAGINLTGMPEVEFKACGFENWGNLGLLISFVACYVVIRGSREGWGWNFWFNLLLGSKAGFFLNSDEDDNLYSYKGAFDNFGVTFGSFGGAILY